MEVSTFAVLPELNAKVSVLGVPPLYFILGAATLTTLNLFAFVWIGGTVFTVIMIVIDAFMMVSTYLNYRDTAKKRYPLFSRVLAPIKRPQVTDRFNILKTMMDAGKGL